MSMRNRESRSKDYNGGVKVGCIFCDIASGKIPAKKVYEDDKIIAFDDIAPQAPVHVIVIPKKHLSGIMAIDDKQADLITNIFRAVKGIAKKKNVESSGFRVVVNHGKDAGQAVEHLHFHVIGGRAMEWPPG